MITEIARLFSEVGELKRQIKDITDNYFIAYRDQQDHDSKRITYLNELIIDLQKKLEERNNSLDFCMNQNHDLKNEMIRKNKIVENHDRRLCEALSRLEKLERKSLLPSETTLTKIINEELAKEQVSVRYVGSVCIPNPYFQKKYSFEEAVKVMFKGYKLTRLAWEDDDVYIKLGDEDSVLVNKDDMQANDWIAIE